MSKRYEKTFCGRDCFDSYQRKPKVIKPCKQCGKDVSKNPAYAKKHPNFFCNHSCSTSYHNIHKTYGIRRSKLEAYLEEQLTTIFPDLPFLFNDRKTINSELDIFIPSLRLAFEINGIFHYEPIFGPEKLKYIKNNDQRKMQACLEQNIEFCTIDSSQLKHFKPKRAKIYLDIIVNIINLKTEGSGPDPQTN